RALRATSGSGPVPCPPPVPPLIISLPLRRRCPADRLLSARPVPDISHRVVTLVARVFHHLLLDLVEGDDRSPRAGKRRGGGHRELIVNGIGVETLETLDQSKVSAGSEDGRGTIVNLVVEIGRFHDERVPLPPAARVA